MNNNTDKNKAERKLKILHIGAEVAPFSTVGGLSRVVRYLSKSLAKRGHEVCIFMPKFGSIDESKYKLETVFKGLKVPTGVEKDSTDRTHLMCNVKRYITEEGVKIYFLENMEYYEKRANVYSYSDDCVRWALLSYGALQYVYKQMEWKPDVIHVHDWHTALVPNIIATKYKNQRFFEDIATVLSIHNIAFQGQAVDFTSDLNFDDGKSSIPSLYSKRLRSLNFLKRGIMYSDVVNTVSEGYAREILSKSNGAGLDKLLLEVRSKLFGIVNGIDTDKINPETDQMLVENYNKDSLDLRVKNKLKIQKEFGLKENPDVPMFAYVGRLDQQKGVDLIIEVMEKFLRDFDAQFVQVGGGDQSLEKAVNVLANKYPKRVGVHTYPNFTLPKLVFGGADIMLMPSRFEPCGIVQMESMRYGLIPIVRAVGGLDDTVDDFNPLTLEGNGFKFKEFDACSLYGQMVRAIETQRNPSIWRRIQRNAMEKDFSWDKVAENYEVLYLKAIHFRTEGFVHGAGRYDS